MGGSAGDPLFSPSGAAPHGTEGGGAFRSAGLLGAGLRRPIYPRSRLVADRSPRGAKNSRPRDRPGARQTACGEHCCGSAGKRPVRTPLALTTVFIYRRAAFERGTCLEPMVLALLGGAVGAAVTWAIFDNFTASTLSENFSQVVFAFKSRPHYCGAD
jgi:hypothetical protein